MGRHAVSAVRFDGTAQCRLEPSVSGSVHGPPALISTSGSNPSTRRPFFTPSPRFMIEVSTTDSFRNTEMPYCLGYRRLSAFSSPRKPLKAVRDLLVTGRCFFQDPLKIFKRSKRTTGVPVYTSAICIYVKATERSHDSRSISA